MYAVIKTGGKQYRVEKGDIIFVEKLPAEADDKVVFEDVLVVGDGGVVERRFVTAPRTLGNVWLVTEGLAPGEKVVVDGFQNIIFSEGAPAPVVTPVDTSLPQGASPAAKR